MDRSIIELFIHIEETRGSEAGGEAAGGVHEENFRG